MERKQFCAVVIIFTIIEAHTDGLNGFQNDAHITNVLRLYRDILFKVL